MENFASEPSGRHPPSQGELEPLNRVELACDEPKLTMESAERSASAEPAPHELGADALVPEAERSLEKHGKKDSANFSPDNSDHSYGAQRAKEETVEESIAKSENVSGDKHGDSAPGQDALEISRSERARNYVQACFQQINLDAQRTGGSAPSSSSSSQPGDYYSVDRHKVAAVLESWVSENAGSVVYTQGLNEVAATLLLRHWGDQSKCKGDLQRLVAPHLLGGLWLSGMPLYEAGRQEFQPLAAARLPKLLAKFEAADVDESAYLPQGWHSLFGKWLPQQLAVAAIDDLLEHGMAALLAITLAILEEVQADILKALKKRGAEPMEVLLGPEGLFRRLRVLLDRCRPSLQKRWKELQKDPKVKEAAANAYNSYDGDDVSIPVSQSLVNVVQNEARQQFASSSARRTDERRGLLRRSVLETREKAIQDERNNDPHFIVKTAVLGDPGVGKSCFIRRSTARGAEGFPSHEASVGFSSTNVKVYGQQAKFQFWDLPGTETFVDMVRPCLDDIAVVFLIYDICRRDSFNGLSEWLKEIKASVSNPDLVFVLVGNKLDKKQNRQVDKDEVRAIADLYSNMIFMECSTIGGATVDLLLAKVARYVYHLIEGIDNRDLPGIKLGARFRSGRSRPCVDRSMAQYCNMM